MVWLLALTACRAEGPLYEPDPGEDPGDEALYPAADRPHTEACRAPKRPSPSGPIELKPAFAEQLDEATREALIGLVEDPAEAGSWLLWRRTGQIHHLRADRPGQHVALDLSAELYLEHAETGLVAVAFEPVEQGARSERVYAIYMAPSPERGAKAMRNVVARFDYDPLSGQIDRHSREVILELPDPNGSHNVNDLLFDEQGMLYIAVGDGGNPYDYLGNGQRSDTLFGTILRIDPSRASEGRAYTIPEDNPFVDQQGRPNEVWAYGLRNPWRMSLDARTGQLWAGDVGQDTWEELNLIERGGNYGWPHMEGPVCYQKADCDPSAYRLPVWSYTHSEGGSITLGPVMRDPALEELDGRPLVGDFLNGNLWAVSASPDESGQRVASLLLESTHNIASFATDHRDQVYAVRYGAQGAGEVFQIVPRAAPSPEENSAQGFPKTLSETGCFQPDDPRQPRPGVFPYQVRAELWSDGASKRRFLHVPPRRRVEVDELSGEMIFPVGSMFFKEFAFQDRPHETRMMVHHEEGWAGYTYRWREDGQDAELLETSQVHHLPGGVRWVYPSRAQCMECHTAPAHRVLGAEMLQLSHLYAPLSEGLIQWRALEELEMFNPQSEERLEELEGELELMPDPFDEGAPLEARARAYLHANCSNCHRPETTSTQANIDLRYATPWEETGLCEVEPEHGRLYRPDSSGFRLIKPGHPELSVVSLRMATLEVFRMPPLSSGVVDERGVALITSWIEQMEDCHQGSKRR